MSDNRDKELFGSIYCDVSVGEMVAVARSGVPPNALHVICTIWKGCILPVAHGLAVDHE